MHPDQPTSPADPTGLHSTDFVQPAPSAGEPSASVLPAQQQVDPTWPVAAGIDLRKQPLAPGAPDGEDGLGRLKRRAGVTYALALVIAVAAAASTIAASDGGVLWTGGFIVAALLLARSVGALRELTQRGLRLSSPLLLLVGVTLVPVLVLCGFAGKSYLDSEASAPSASDPGSDEVGSCWSSDDGGQVLQVGCDSAKVAYVAASEVADAEECVGEGYLDGRPGYYLCLSAR